MSLRRQASPRRDANEPAIVAALRKVGALVERISCEGVPDLLVSYKKKPFLLEIKLPGKGLTPAQEKWHALWKGAPIHVVHTPEEALVAIGAIQPTMRSP